jgi:TfoX/Sxy family transcriptional regulator of competence genes
MVLTARSAVYSFEPMSRDKQKTEIPAEKLALYDRLIRERPHIARKGVGLPYTSVNGHMFSFLSASGSLALRLPVDERKAFQEKYGTSLFVAHGTVLKEYVEVPEKLLASTGELLAYLDRSYAYAQGLKPKQQKKPAGIPKKRARKA